MQGKVLTSYPMTTWCEMGKNERQYILVPPCRTFRELIKHLQEIQLVFGKPLPMNELRDAIESEPHLNAVTKKYVLRELAPVAQIGWYLVKNGAFKKRLVCILKPNEDGKVKVCFMANLNEDRVATLLPPSELKD